MTDDLKKQAEAEINELARQNGGRIKPEQLVEFARDEDTACHKYFEWSDDKAADLYRVEQARTLIRSVKIEVTTETKVIKCVGYVRDPDLDGDETGYVSVGKIRTEEDAKHEMLVSEIKRLDSIAKRVKALALAVGLEEEAKSFFESLDLLRRVIHEAPTARQ